MRDSSQAFLEWKTEGVSSHAVSRMTGSPQVSFHFGSYSESEADYLMRYIATVPFSPFNLTYYQSYFDVDTKTVLQRCFASFIPREGFIDDTCEQRVDLYGERRRYGPTKPFILTTKGGPGPFWGLTTLCLTIYLSSSLSNSIANYISRGSTDPTGVREQDLTLLSFIVTLIYLYGLAFPAAFWAVTRWLALRSAGNEAGGGAEGVGWTLPEAWAIWGYAMVIWIPVSVSIFG